MGIVLGRDVSIRARRHVGAIAGLCALAYFGFHLLAGERGLLAWVRLDNEVETARTALEISRGEQLALEHQVGLMRPENLDPDMLDEQARAALGFARPDELVVFTPAGAD